MSRFILHPNFPKDGVVFKEINLSNPDFFKFIIDSLTDFVKNNQIDAIAALDSRGFIYASPVCYNLHKPLLLIRKKGKLPGKTISLPFKKEYSDSEPEELEVQLNTLKKGSTIAIIDDILATGGTLKATIELLKKCNYNPLYSLVVTEIEGLNPLIKKEFKVVSIL